MIGSSPELSVWRKMESSSMVQKCFLWTIVVYVGLFTPGVILECACIGIWGFSHEKCWFIFMFKIYFWGRKSRVLCFVHLSKTHFTVKFLVSYPALLYLFVEVFDLKHMVWATEGYYLSFSYLPFCCSCAPRQINKNGSYFVLSKGPNLKEMTG